MNFSPEVVEDVLVEYKRTRSPFRTAKNTGLDASSVWAIIEANSDRLTSFQERHQGQGRPEIQKYLVARRKVTTREWDNAEPTIAKARSDYEAGTHELATGRDGGWLLMYSIPRKKTAPRPNYFKPESI